MGYFFALLSSLLFTFYSIPKKFSNIKSVYYVFFMGLSCLICSIVFYFFSPFKESLFNKFLLVSFLGGVSWFVASTLFFVCVDKIGVARSTQFKSLQGPIGSIMILLILSEYSNLNVYLLMIAMFCILLSSFMLVIKDNDDKKINYKYILLILLSSLLYGFSGFIRKSVTRENIVYSQQIYSSLGIVLSALIYIFISKKKITKKENIKKYSLALLSGLFYYFASFLMVLSYKYIEGSITFSLIQLNAVWAGIIGIFIFKEIDYKKHYIKLLLSLIFALTGIFLLLIC